MAEALVWPFLSGRSWGIRTGRGITLGVPAGKEKNGSLNKTVNNFRLG